MVEDMLAARRVIVFHQPVKLRATNSAGTLPRISASDQPAGSVTNVTSTRPSSPSGERNIWLWRAVEQDGFVLDVLVQGRRSTKAAKSLMRKLLKEQGLSPPAMIGATKR
jgi:putative transposase